MKFQQAHEEQKLDEWNSDEDNCKHDYSSSESEMPSQESTVEELHETETSDSSVEVEPGVRIEGSETPRIGGIKGGGLLPHHKSIDFHTDIWSNLGPDSAMKLRDLIITEIVSHTFGDRDNAWSLFSEHRLIKDTNSLGTLKNDFIECRTAAHNTLKEFIDTSHKIYNNKSANAIVTTKHPVAKFCKEQKETSGLPRKTLFWHPCTPAR